MSNEKKVFEANCDGAFIPGKQGRLFATIYNPAGEGPFPVIIVCHGFPGNERMLGYADYLRDFGFCTVHFHYSGSWGSDGDFSFENCTRDVDSVIEYVLKDESGLFDKDRLFIMGHSMGGFMTCYAVGNHPEIKAAAVLMPGNIGGYIELAESDPGMKAELKGLFDEFGAWLSGYDYEIELANWKQYPGKYVPQAYAEALSKIPALFIAGTNDPSPLGEDGESDVWPLVRAVQAYGTGKEEVHEFTTDHGMNSDRPKIKETVSGFFTSVCESL